MFAKHCPKKVQKVDMTWLLLIKDLLQFDSQKQPSPKSDHLHFAFWVVTCETFNYTSPTYTIIFFLTFYSGTGSGAEERGATGGPPQSASVDVVATPKFSAGGVKLGNSQSLRVRLDSYPAGKLHCSFFVVVDKVYSSYC